MQYAYRAIIVFWLFLCMYWLEFNETLVEHSFPRGDENIIVLFRSDLQDRVMALDKLCNMHIEQYCYFFLTAGLISTDFMATINMARKFACSDKFM
jgi:hypothetical protein